MPMIDLYVPEGALTPQAETGLIEDLTRIALEAEGLDHESPAARSLAWVFLHRPAEVTAGGVRVAEPRYRVVVSVPEGQWSDARRERLVSDATGAVLAAEGCGADDPLAALRVWVLALEVPDGAWGAAGRVTRLGDIMGFVLGNAAAGAAHAAERLASHR